MNLMRYLPRFRQAYRSLATLAARETWSRAEIEEYQLERLNALWGQAIQSVPYYRRLAKSDKLPAQFASLREFQARVPVVRKSAVQAQPKEFLSCQAAPGKWHRTGGSTGAPMDCYWGAESYREVLHSRYRFLQAWGLDIFDRTAFLWGHSNSFLPGWSGWLARRRTPLEDRLRNRIRLSAYRLGPRDVQQYLRRVLSFRPRMIYGYSTAIELLALEAEATGARCDELKLLTLTGEPATSRVVACVERAFRAPAVVEYGSVECGVIASEYPDRKLRVREDRVFLETLPDHEGRYEIVVTIFGNPSFPLIRYAIEDLTDAPVQRPAGGFATLSRVLGRNNDFIFSKSGGRIHSSRFDALFKYGAGAVRRFRVCQDPDGSLQVACELASAESSFDVSAVRRQIVELVEGFPVDLQVTASIPQTAAGKHRLVTSEMLVCAHAVLSSSLL